MTGSVQKWSRQSLLEKRRGGRGLSGHKDTLPSPGLGAASRRHSPHHASPRTSGSLPVPPRLPTIQSLMSHGKGAICLAERHMGAVFVGGRLCDTRAAGEKQTNTSPLRRPVWKPPGRPGSAPCRAVEPARHGVRRQPSPRNAALRVQHNRCGSPVTFYS